MLLTLAGVLMLAAPPAADPVWAPLRADYYDNEGRVIRYAVTASSAAVVFLSDGFKTYIKAKAQRRKPL